MTKGPKSFIINDEKGARKRMRRTSMKKPWQTPELVILFRGRPEEAVLCNCKHANMAAVSPHTFNNSCNLSATCCSTCQNTTAAS